MKEEFEKIYYIEKKLDISNIHEISIVNKVNLKNQLNLAYDELKIKNKKK
jgi:hypothetical protein